MASKALPSQEVLRQLLDYNPDTGLLTWRHRGIEFFHPSETRSAPHICSLWNARYAGTPALNHSDKQGYRCGAILGQNWKAHRIIWKLAHNIDADQIDHINGATGDNRLENLRNVDQTENSRNLRVYARNHSGVHGVVWHKRIAKWAAQIKAGPKTNHLGYFDLFQDAVAVRKAAERAHGFHKNHGRAA